MIGCVAGIIAALTGSGIWSMAWMVLSTDLVIAIMMLFAAKGAATPNLHLRELREILPFSLRIFGSNALAFLSRNTDNILVGRFLGVGALSLYSMSYRVLVVPVQMIGQTVNRVVFPLFARLQDRVDLVAKGLLRGHGRAGPRRDRPDGAGVGGRAGTARPRAGPGVGPGSADPDRARDRRSEGDRVLRDRAADAGTR